VTFANPLPPWALAAIVLAAIGVAWLAYRYVPIAPSRRHALSALRLATLLWIVVCLLRPSVRATASPCATPSCRCWWTVRAAWA
jgi:hypothetical protein